MVLLFYLKFAPVRRKIMDIPPLQLSINAKTVLRPIEENDALEMFTLIEQDRAHLRPWLPWLDTTLSAQDLLGYIRSVQQQYAQSQSLTCSIIYDGHLAGSIGYNSIDWQDRKTELGYWLGAAFEGKGLMTQACEEMLWFAFNVLELNKVEIHCATGNTRSRAIPERLHFTQEGTIRQAQWLYDHYVDLVVYGMLASEWKR
jgi:ribosomal-protein-serine acetyltransferase